MSIATTMKRLRKKADHAVAEHKDEIQRAAKKAETIVDRRTGGKYHDRIERAGAKFGSYVENGAPRVPGHHSNRSRQSDAASGR